MITNKDIKSIILQLKNLEIIDWMWIFEIFRNKIKKIFKSKYIILTNNWTSALYLAYKALWIKEWDEVITWTYTYHSTNSTLLHFTNNIKFCDIDKNLTISLKDIKKYISNNTKLLVIPHTYGLSPNMEEIINLKNKFKNLKIIEDCSQAHLWRYNNKLLGTFWDIWIFSMQAWKLLPAWEWWFIITNNEKLYENILINSDSWKTLYNLLPKNSQYRDFIDTWLWLKFRPNSLWIALANSQIDNLPIKIKNRQYFMKLIKKELNKYNFIEFPEIKNHYNSWYALVWIYNSNYNIKNLLQECYKIWINEIYTPLNNKPNHLLKIFNSNIKLKKSEYVYNNLLYFKLFDDKKYENIIINYIKKFKKILDYKKIC
jgi:dTDP-4-amino-4,6-dideoxygalactose transaminase